MAFKLGDLVIDRIQLGSFFRNDDLVGICSQLTNASIEITAESKDAKDATGTIIKRFWNAKTGTFSATSALINTTMMGISSGNDIKYSETAAPIVMPAMYIVKASGQVTVTGLDADTIVVKPYNHNGSADVSVIIEKSSTSTPEANKYAVSGNIIKAPTGTVEGVYDEYIICCDRNITADGIEISNTADKFPDSCRVVLKCLCVDPCATDTLRACYVELPSAQPSPETTIELNTEATMEIKFDLQAQYCGSEKLLYRIVMCEADIED